MRRRVPDRFDGHRLRCMYLQRGRDVAFRQRRAVDVDAWRRPNRYVQADPLSTDEGIAIHRGDRDERVRLLAILRAVSGEGETEMLAQGRHGGVARAMRIVENLIH